MNHLQKRRMVFVTLFITCLSVGIALILYALKQNINVFLTPRQINAAKLPLNYAIRLGGMVKKGSLVRDQSGLGITFIVTDFKDEIGVRYEGILPDLFREGKGVVALGTMNKAHVFIATQILAKHDENYMPKKITND